MAGMCPWTMRSMVRSSSKDHWACSTGRYDPLGVFCLAFGITPENACHCEEAPEGDVAIPFQIQWIFKDFVEIPTVAQFLRNDMDLCQCVTKSTNYHFGPA